MAPYQLPDPKQLPDGTGTVLSAAVPLAVKHGDENARNGAE